MDTLTDRIMTLEGDLVLDACKNLRLGLRHQLKQQGDTSQALSDAESDALGSPDLQGDASDARTVLLDEADPQHAIELGRLTLLVAAEQESLRPYVEGAVVGAETGVRAVDPISILTIGAAIYMVGRLLPEIEYVKESSGAQGKTWKTSIKIKPLKDPLAGLAAVIKAIPTVGRG
jgi:hypothetical protein